jgi:TonB-linked SusC/RagA family outer membrane protein
MNKHIKMIFAILSFVLLFQVIAIAQDPTTIVVKDANGNPLAGATVIVGEDGKPALTNDRGEITFTVRSRTAVLVQAEGFESQIVSSAPGSEAQIIVLTKMPFHMSERDIVHVPFGKIRKRQITGAITTLRPEEILAYDYQGGLNSIMSGRVPGLFGSSNIRGIGGPMYVIDGIARPTAPMINIHEVEQISVLKDISTAMLYGPQALNGVVFITTKRGEPLKKSLIFNVEKGMNKPISYPSYLSAADYMGLYNEALENDGLSPRYTSDQISKTRSGTDPIRYPDEDYYNSTYLENWADYHNINAEVSGGNDIAQFFLNVGWGRSNSLLKLGEGANERTDRLNMRGNIDYEITNEVKLTFDGAVMFNISNGPRYTSASNDFWALSSTLRPDIYPVLIPLNLFTDESQKQAARPIGGDFVFGGTSEFQTNIYGELTRNGTRGFTDRLLGLTTGLDFDLSSIAKGLTSRAYFSFDMYNQYREEILNSYAVYRPNYSEDALSSFTKYKTDLKVHNQTVGDAFYYRRYGVYGTLDYNRVFGDHQLSATALVYRDEYSVEEVLQNTKHLHFGARVNYMFQNKYVAQLTGVQAGSLKLFEGKRWSLSPGIGLGWIISEEDFLEGNPLIDYLKLRTNWAILQTDENLNYRLDRDYYTSGSSFQWSQGTYSNPGRNVFYGNPNLGWEKIMNYSVGFESALMDYRLNLEAGYFYNKYYDVITQRVNSLPGFFGNLPFENYGSYQTQGIELGLNYSAKIGEIKARLGGNFVHSVPKVLVMDELNYEDEYRRNTGKATDAIFGLVAMGLYKDQADIENSVRQDFGPVRPGDIKYKDLNNDGIIDDADMTIIGNSRARTEYGLNLMLQYKSFDLFALGRGQMGQERSFNNPYYWVYGDRKYSEVVWNRWTPQTWDTATYPRLSSTANANNFRNSTFWLYETNWFSLSTMQLTYTRPGSKFAGIEGMRFFLRGSNLAMISKEKEKLQLNVGSQPQMRSYSLGVNLMF